jgi:hypothetical protein
VTFGSRPAWVIGLAAPEPVARRVWALVHYVQRRTLSVFVAYRITLGLVLLAFASR